MDSRMENSTSLPSFLSIMTTTTTIIIISILMLTVQTASLRDSSSSFYDVLRSHGLPIGLLPKGVTAFTIDESGRFEAHLDRPCTAKFENDVHYDQNVTGTLSYGQMGALSGISAQELFLWFPVKGIRVDIPSSGLIYFDVGVIYKQFSLSLFETPPDCRDADRIGRRQETAAASLESKYGNILYKLNQEEREVI